MRYIQLNKASGAFDALCAENIKSIKLDVATDTLGKINVLYVGDSSACVIVPAAWDKDDAATHFVQADVQAIIKAIINDFDFKPQRQILDLSLAVASVG
jgi:hypothetical protein